MFKRNALLNTPFITVDQNTFNKDNEILEIIRTNIKQEILNLDITNIQKILEIGPSDDINKTFKSIRNLNDTYIYHTLDIIDKPNITYTADLTKELNIFEKYDLILLCEVLEHTTNPFNVIKNLEKLLNPNGIILITFPFNFRLHGPLPDCWRISEYGFKSIISETLLKIIKLDALILEERPYFPIHYISIVTNI
jgi:SAM-dependent methyltransferase